MSDKEQESDSLMTTLAILGIYVGSFMFLHGLIKMLTGRKLLVHTAGFSIVLAQLFGSFALYDLKLQPLAKGPRWPNCFGIFMGLCYIYLGTLFLSVVAFIVDHHRHKKLRKSLE